MNQQLKTIQDFIQQNDRISQQDKEALLKSVKDADKEFSITTIKLDDTETEKHATAILLEETIEELEQKRKTVETQNRELQIEASLERVRAISMAMRKPDDLLSICEILFAELRNLAFSELRNTLIHTFIDEKNYFIDYDYSDFTGGRISHIPYSGHPVIEKFIKAIRKANDAFIKIEITGQELQDWKEFRKANGEADDPRLNNMTSLYYYNYSIGAGGIGISTFSSISDDKLNVLKRFRNVFDLSYQRYTDITLAEAQAREAKIEAALEKVRSRSLAMHQSDELKDVITVVQEKLQELDIAMESRVAVIVVFKKGSRDFNQWIASPNLSTMYVSTPYYQNPILDDFWTAKEAGVDFYSKAYSIEEKDSCFKFFFEHSRFENVENLAGLEEQKKWILEREFYSFSPAFEKNSSVGIADYSGKPLKESEIEIVKRFSKVFEQAYIRFLDLQKAEAQAKEAKIEAALERIRSSAMAMHSSEGILEVTHVLREQIALLGEKELESILVHIYHEDTDQFEAWYSYRHPEYSKGQIVNGKQTLNWSKTARARKDKEKYYEKETDYTIVADHKMLKEWYGYLFKLVPEVVELNDKGEILVPDVLYYNYSKISGGTLLLITNSEASDHSKYLLRRAATVFSLAYSRFLDLQKAEAQAREAKIEASLERIRGKAMAMHSSEDLAATIVTFYHELQLFSITPRRCGVGLLNKENRIAELSTMNSTVEGNSIDLIGKMDLTVHPVLEGVYENWLIQKEYHPVLRGNEIKEYYLLVRPQIAFPDYPDDDVMFGYFFFFPEGGVYAWTDKKMVDDELKIYRRFTSVLSLTYKRYKDLKDAETNAREAVKQAALDRVRAEIASMRTTNDLERITPLIWNELTIIGIPFIRCGVFIMDDSQQLIHTFLSTPEGKAIAAFHLPYDTQGNIGNVLSHWQKRKNYIDHWDETTFTEFADTLVKQGFLTSSEQYMKTFPGGGFYLHFLPFLQGMLYVGNTEKLDENEIKLIQSVANAFSTAYARYEDFNKLEAAKKQVDKTLVELKQAQTQLVQSEKMASLGELTAGIAHEIQNPLNFVNNFSEVNTELIDEMKSELAMGNGQGAMSIADDIKENEQKINHHGKRADAIVKGMLLHSRVSGGQKDLTDINALADEYLRLSYHGLRAKDKSLPTGQAGFNADFKTNFDETIGKINIIPQDIGRVLLNLYNNAFYAVAEKMKSLNQEVFENHPGFTYEPIVLVSTKKINNKIEIKVKDNGNGISQKILDKIFQPFFTTKPTGQGTGLGLSLSYDILKAHGGEIKVETKEGEYTEFIILLPLY